MAPVETQLPGAFLLEPTVHGDHRGFFVETFRASNVGEMGLAEGTQFIQDNHSRSSRGVICAACTCRSATASPSWCAAHAGAIVDVIVDLREGSPTYGRWQAFELSDESLHQLLVPVGFGHGFCVTSEVADVIYKQTGYYDPELERGFAYDDPEVGIDGRCRPRS